MNTRPADVKDRASDARGQRRHDMEQQGCSAPPDVGDCPLLTPVQSGAPDYKHLSPHAEPADRSAFMRIEVRVGSDGLPGELSRVPYAQGSVIFAHGSGSSRSSPRNRLVAHILNGYHLNTLLFDLLTDTEAADPDKRFDIELLSHRLGSALQWSLADELMSRLRIGVFGASTGAAAALQAAARHPGWVAAVVSRGGRPDLVGAQLKQVQAPTLLVVGGNDTEVLQFNRSAMRMMACEARLEVVPGASHLFEEPGALKTVAHLAGNWFARHLPLRMH